jgi:hypothetical protein
MGSLQIGKRGSPGRILPLVGSQPSAVEIAPENTERVEGNRVSDCQLARIYDNLAGIANNGIQCQAPALVADDALTVLTS